MKTLRTPAGEAAIDARAASLLWLGLGFMLVPLLVRAMSPLTVFPEWDLSPVMYSVPTPSITPWMSMLGDGLSLLGSGLVMMWATSRGMRVRVLPWLLLGIGAVGIVLHGWVLGPNRGSLGDQRIGAAWLSALVAGVTIMHAAQDARARRLIASVLLGFVCVLLLRGVLQVLVEHPQSLQNFKENKERILAAHGWSPGSAMALGFERRLSQPEASGWFGLSNVYASICAGIGTIGLGLAFRGFRDRKERGGAILPVICAAVIGAGAVGGVVLANSKGGVIALGTGLAALTVLSLLARVVKDAARLRVIGGVIGVLAIAGPLLMVLVRGAIGERMGELSILFRWFYMQASARIFADYPIFGVGPDGYQRAFLIAKPPICPEEVSSPHSILWDYASTLGLFGVALGALIVLLAWKSGARAFECSASSAGDRRETRSAFMIIAAATIGAVWLQTTMITPEMAGVYVVGLVLWCGAAWGVQHLMGSVSTFGIAFAAGAMALLAHAQIEVTGSFVASAGIWLGLIGVGAAGTGQQLPPLTNTRFVAHVTGLVVVVLAGLMVFTAVGRARTWETHLRTAADAVRIIPAMSERLGALGSPDGLGDSIERIVSDLSAATGSRVEPTQASVGSAMLSLERQRYPVAVRALESAYEVYPDDRRPLREASTLLARLAESAGDPQTARALFDQAVGVLRLADTPASKAVGDPQASEFGWMALVLERQAKLLGDTDAFRRAVEARERVNLLDPYNLDNVVRLAKSLDALGEKSRAVETARRAIELDGFMRLDLAVKGLSKSDREAMEQLAK